MRKREANNDFDIIGARVGPQTAHDRAAEPDLFTAHARTADPETSKEVARKLTDATLTASEAAVLACFKWMCGGSAMAPTSGAVLHGMTDATMIWHYNRMKDQRGWPKQSDSGLRSRRAALVRKGKLRDTGERERLLATGNNATVWGLRGCD